MSITAARTRNPIREVVESIHPPSPAPKTIIPLSLGTTIYCFHLCLLTIAWLHFLVFLGDPTLYGNLKTPSVFVQAIEDSLRCESLMLSRLVIVDSALFLHAVHSSIMVTFTQLAQHQPELQSPHVTRSQLRPLLLTCVLTSHYLIMTDMFIQFYVAV